VAFLFVFVEMARTWPSFDSFDILQSPFLVAKPTITWRTLLEGEKRPKRCGGG